MCGCVGACPADAAVIRCCWTSVVVWVCADDAAVMLVGDAGGVTYG